MTKILQLDSSGQPTKWITWKKAITYHAKKLVAWELGKVENVYHGGFNCHGERSVVVTSSIMAIKGKPSKRKYKIPALNNIAMFRRDRHLCAYCGNMFFDNQLTRDHIMPESRGGKDTWMNCVTCCGRCNQRKDNKTPQEAGMELLYVPYVPSRIEYLILKERVILEDQMEFLLSFIPDDSPIKKHLTKMQ